MKNTGRTLAALGQKATDTVEEKGIPYVVSYAVTDFAIGKLADVGSEKLRGLDKADDFEKLGSSTESIKNNFVNKVKHICRVERWIMIFGYEELKECIEEDFEQFYRMGFNEKQIFPAVLNEYEHGKDFCLVENICIHVLLALNYAEKN